MSASYVLVCCLVASVLPEGNGSSLQEKRLKQGDVQIDTVIRQGLACKGAVCHLNGSTVWQGTIPRADINITNIIKDVPGVTFQKQPGNNKEESDSSFGTDGEKGGIHHQEHDHASVAISPIQEQQDQRDISDAIGPTQYLARADQPTKKEISRVYRQYRELLKSPTALGLQIFKRLFQAHPEAISFFDHISTDDNQLLDSPRFHIHVRKVVEIIYYFVKNLKYGETLSNEQMMRGLAILHKGHLVKPTMTRYVTEAILYVLDHTDGTPDKEAWQHVLDYLLNDMYNSKLKQVWHEEL